MTPGPCPLQTLEKAPRDPYECTGSEPNLGDCSLSDKVTRTSY